MEIRVMGREDVLARSVPSQPEATQGAAEALMVSYWAPHWHS